MADAIWDHTNEEHRRAMLALLSPLVAATRPREFADKAMAKDQAIAWILCLKDVPREVLEEGRNRLLATGPKFMPRPGELREACADVIDERRALMAQRVAEMKARCPLREDGTCTNDWIEVEWAMKRCDCHTRGLQMMQQVAAPIARPALEAGEVA